MSGVLLNEDTGLGGAVFFFTNRQHCLQEYGG